MRALLSIIAPLSLFANEISIVPRLEPGNTAFVFMATVLVMFMSPAGLAFFYGGMTRGKNVLNTLAMSFSAYAIASVVWILWGYSLAFGNDINGLIGDFSQLGLSGITLDANTTSGILVIKDSNGVITANVGIPMLLFVAFQMTFAGITLAVVSGAVIERMKFVSWLLFGVLWLTFVYAPIAHWVWGGGFLSNMGVLDFAGGYVVEINSGISGLTLAILLGRRKDLGKTAIFPFSVAFTTLGAAMLWFGWFGFNAGSELQADLIAANAFLTTNTAAACGLISWGAVEYVKYKKFTLIGMASGAVAGLVAITPAAGFVSVNASLLIGLIAGIIGFWGVNYLKAKLKYDDSLDVFGVHALCGIWGVIATGIFANPQINTLGKGIIYGNSTQFLTQLEAVAIVAIYSAFATFVVYKVVTLFTNGARASSDDEGMGLDEAEHGETAFHF
ncbi:MAG: hypothetical protein RL154_269 [Pseudomonadota bacterium]